MDLNEYQHRIARFDRSPNTLWYYGLGLAGEAGEAANKLKKSYRQEADPLNQHALALELGDVLWYLARLADRLGYSLSTVAVLNIEKLERRERADTLVGDGDDR
jgi:NTP pyrophosphatase (non-canonical NTP hydrolase)